MASESVTKTVEFDHAPAYPCGMFQVNAGIDTTHALGSASIISTYVRDRLQAAVGTGMETDEPWILALMTDMTSALVDAAGAKP